MIAASDEDVPAMPIENSDKEEEAGQVKPAARKKALARGGGGARGGGKGKNAAAVHESESDA